MINTTVISFDGNTLNQINRFFSMRMRTSFFFISSVFCSFGYVSVPEVFFKLYGDGTLRLKFKVRSQLLKCMEPVAICAKLCDKSRTVPAEGDPDWMVYNPAQCEFCSGSKSVYFILIFNFVLETSSRFFLAGCRVGIIGPSNPGISSEKLRLEVKGSKSTRSYHWQ